jgi:hypothetical protein
VGASRAACPPASTTCSMARSATMVLPEPTSPCSSRFIGESRAKFGRQGLSDGGLPSRQGERQLAVEGGEQSLRHGTPGGGFLRSELGAAAGQGRLEDQRFLVAEPVPALRQSCAVSGAWMSR